MFISRYIVQETVISSVINGLFSLLFAYLVFWHAELTTDNFAREILIDAIPQGIAIGFMGAFFASFLTRKRIASGAISSVNGQVSRLPAHPLFRALIFSLCGALISVGAFFIIITALGNTLLENSVIVLVKVIWGMVLGAASAYIALRFALVDYAPVSSKY